MDLIPNPLAAGNASIKSADLQALESPTVLVRSAKSRHKRDLIDLRRGQSACDALAPLDLATELYGFTKGQFSMLDMIGAMLDKTGPASMVLSTWTANAKEIDAILKMKEAGKLLDAKWLIDFTFVRRDAAAAHSIRQGFGAESIRIASSHAKFVMLTNAEWKLVCRTSMNLNMNPRFEDFLIGHDPALFDFLQAIINEIWTKQPRTLGDDGRRRDFFNFWRDEL